MQRARLDSRTAAETVAETASVFPTKTIEKLLGNLANLVGKFALNSSK
jgi:hypothetical protein